ncbi:MAG: hypothetical protein VYC34_11710 [Planctomycetota bacterium]|nr:hypothetical protein [Planctomycetota bacterium]
MHPGVTIDGAIAPSFPRLAATPSPLERPRTPADAARRRRVILLVLAMVLMGLADLSLTLTYMKSVGMFEVNPIARFMIAIGGEGQLIRYKLFTIVLSGGLLYLLRRHRCAELCAWLGCAAMLALTVHWTRYNSHIILQGPPDHTLAHITEAWVFLGDP